MAESPLYTKPKLKMEDVAIEDMMGIAHPRGGTSDDMAITVLNLAEAMGIGTFVHNRCALVAKYDPVTHQQKNVGFQQGLPPLPAPPAGAPPGFLTAAKNRANTLKSELAKHGASIGTRLEEGAHKAADINPIGTDATDLASTITLTKALAAWLKAHATRVGVHFRPDPEGAAFVLPYPNPTVLAEVTADLNALTPALQKHVAYGVA